VERSSSRKRWTLSPRKKNDELTTKVDKLIGMIKGKEEIHKKG
jgi:hypothetical protein